MIDQTVALRVEEINKSFPGVRVLQNMNMEIRAGEVHSLVGENGAGKSTLIKIISGVHRSDSGHIFLNQEEVQFQSTKQAMESGISCIYQELSIVPLLDVAKNLYLGNIPVKKSGVVDHKTLYSGAQNILNMLDLKVNPHTQCKELSIAQCQMVEIGRALTRNSKVIIMDEPTSSITDKEKEVLFQVIGRLKAQGVAVIYVSHKLDEVLEISDRITVLRDGVNIETLHNDGTITKDDIIRRMIGRTIENYYNKQPAKIGEPVLEARQLSKAGLFHEVNFTLHSGEVLGFFGLVGAGRSEIAEAVVGANRADTGEILVENKPVRIHGIKDAIGAGICLVPEDRKRQGVVLKLGVGKNISMARIDKDSKLGFLNQKSEKQVIEEYLEQMNIKTPTADQLVGKLSGGNQQKVVMAKWLCMNPKVLILDEPTRGIDVGTKSEIYSLISRLAGEGVALLVISSELPEIMGICDRILTIYEGRVTAEISRADFSEETIMKYAFGGGEDYA